MCIEAGHFMRSTLFTEKGRYVMAGRNAKELTAKMAEHELCLIGVCRVLEEHGVDETVHFGLLCSWLEC